MGKPGARKLDQIISVTPGDVHIIMVPSPAGPVPTPIPHPVPNSMIKDKVAKKVKVMGQPGAVKGSKSQHTPPHIPMGPGPFQKPPGNKGKIITGSSNVFYEGKEAAMLGDTAKMCMDPSDAPVGKVIGKAATVLVGGGSSGGGAAREKASADAMKAAAAACHKWINENMPPGADREQAHREVCSATGHPIDVVTGKMFTRDIDLELPGRIPFKFVRNYSSARSDLGAFGCSWRHSYDIQLILHSDFVSYRDENGRFLEFEPVALGETSWNNLGRLTLSRTHEGYWIEDAEGLKQFFGTVHSKKGNAAILSIQYIVDRYNNRISFEYDGNSRLRQIIDTAGRKINLVYNEQGFVSELRMSAQGSERYKIIRKYSYSEQGDLVEWRDENDNPYRFEYKNHLLVKETDRKGFSFYFTYDKDGWCRETWGEGGILHRKIEYDIEKQKTRVIDSHGYFTLYEWNELGVVNRETDHRDNTWTFEYNDSLQPLRSEDPEGHTWTHEYDDKGRLTTQENPEGNGIACEYDNEGRLTVYINEAGKEWRRESDDESWTNKYINPNGEITLETLNDKGDAIRIRYPDGKESSCTYDNSGNLLTLISENGATIRRSYSPEGNILGEYDQQGQTFRIDYDRKGSPKRSWQRGKGETKIERDSEGQITRTVDAKGRITEYEYTDFYKLSRIVHPEGVTLSSGNISQVSKTYFYDTENRVTKVEFLGRETASFHYDGHDSPISCRYPDGRVQTCERDGRGVITKLFENGDLLFKQESDFAGRPLRRITGDGDELSFEYDPIGNLVNASGSDGIGEVEIEYDDLGRKIIEQGTFGGYEKNFEDFGNTQNYAWNDDFKLIFGSSGKPDGTILTTTRNDREEITLKYNALNRLIRTDFANGEVQRLQYGKGNMPISRSDFVPSKGDTILDYHYDSEEWLTSVDKNGLPFRSYERDELDRLVSMDRWEEGQKQKFSWGFDKHGNRITTTDAAGEEHHNEYERGNKLVKIGDEKLTYDEHGRVITWADANGNTKHFAWNTLGQLIKVTLSDGQTVEMRYDALGRRIEKISPEGATRFAWENNLMVHEIRPDGEERHYIYQPGSYTPLACYIKQENDDWRLHSFLNDQIGMPTRMTNDEGRVVWEAELSPYGEIIKTKVEETSQSISLPGQYRDDETGLCYNFFRYYLPKAGAYLSPDPIGLRGGDDVYAYVKDPVCWSDPLGLTKEGNYGNDSKATGRGNLSHAENFDKARKEAFENAGLTDPDTVKFSKEDPETGTIVEFKGEKGAKVAYDAPHADKDPAKGHDKPHVGWQSGGKQPSGGHRGNITYDGPQHPSRSKKK